MEIQKLKENWNEWGKKDPLWGVLTWSNKKNNQWEPSEFFKTGELEIESVFEYLKLKKIDVKSSKALDFGCGVGRLTQALANEFDQVIGVDIAPSMIDKAKYYNKVGERCIYLVNDTDNLELFEDNTFDFVYSNIVLQHMEPRYSKKYLQEFIRVLKRGGVAIFQIPSEKKQTESKKLSFSSRVRRRIKLMIQGSTKQVGNSEPIMEMHGIYKDDLVEIINQHGADILDIADDNSTNKWVSYRYCIQKK